MTYPWTFGAVDPAAEVRLVDRLGVSPLTAQVLVARGFATPEAARAFLYPDLRQSPDPFLMSGMEEAVRRVARALERDERILVYGDYDVDGQSSTALVVRTLRLLGAEAVAHYVPHRVDEGYGLHPEAVREIAASGVDLMITVDCGITAMAEAGLAAELGLDLIVTDHHQPPDELPAARAVLDPHKPGCNYPEKELAGVGVAYKFARALTGRLGGGGTSPDDVDAMLDLVALGTVADSVPLVGENRALVRAGLERMNHSPNVGLRALIEVAGLNGAEIGAGQIAWTLGPRINAVGRMDDAALGVRLLLTENPLEAAQLAQTLDAHNARRQQVEAEVLEAAVRQIDARPTVAGGHTGGAGSGVVAWGEGWHPGVIGIVASRLVERYDCPAIVLSVEGEEAKGSGRSVSGVNLYEVLKSCGDVLTQFGGHPMAAGLRLRYPDVEGFSEKFAALVGARMPDVRQQRPVRVDGLVELSSLNQEAVSELARLGPYGVGNPAPTMLTEALSPTDVRGVGQDGRHLKLTLADRAAETVGAIGFSMAEEWISVLQGEAGGGDGGAPSVHVAGVPELNVWRGRASVQLRLRSLRTAPPEPGEPFPFARPGGWEAVCWEIADEAEFDPRPDRNVADPAGDAAADAIAGRALPVPALHDARGIDSPAGAATKLFWAAFGRAPDRSPALRLYLRTRLAAFQLARSLWAAHPDLRPHLALEGRRVRLGRVPADGSESVLLLQMPPSVPALVREIRGARSVWFLYPGDDAEAGAAELRRAYPEREALGHVYRACVQSASVNGGRLERIERLAARAGRLAGGRMWPEAVEAALHIFAEIGLVTAGRAGGEPAARLGPKPDVKLDLNVSLRYNEGVRAEALFAEAVELARKPLESVVPLIQSPSAS